MDLPTNLLKTCLEGLSTGFLFDCDVVVVVVVVVVGIACLVVVVVVVVVVVGIACLVVVNVVVVVVLYVKMCVDFERLDYFERASDDWVFH